MSQMRNNRRRKLQKETVADFIKSYVIVEEITIRRTEKNSMI